MLPFPDLPLNARYADDGTIAVPIPIARQVIDFLVTKGAPRGFSINLRKTRLGGRRFHRQILKNSAICPALFVVTILSKFLVPQ